MSVSDEDFDDDDRRPAHGASPKERQGNRRAGVETYQNMLRIMFALRDAPLVSFRDPHDQIRAMTATEIAAALKNQDLPPSVATIRKYLFQLETQRPAQVEVLHDTPGRDKYWRLKSTSPLHRKGLSDFEAAMVCVASEILEPVLPPHLQNHLRITRERAQEMLVNARPIGAMPDDSPVWMLKLVNRIWIEPPPPVVPAVLDAVFKAVSARKRLTIEYLSMAAKREGRAPARVTLSPLRLVQHGDARLYLIGSDIEGPTSLESHQSQAEGYRRFALHRILSATIMESSVVSSRPELERLIDEQPGFEWQGKVDLVAMIHTDIVLRLEESRINASQHIDYQPGKPWHRLEVEVDLNWELRWWILSNGSHMIIHEPAALRDEIAAHFRQGEAAYRAISKPIED
jgi:predicted DNA-binding transcriptional regulator YafY